MTNELPTFVTAGKLVQDDLQRCNAHDGQARRELLHGLLTISFDALALVEDGHILTANDRYATMFGYGIDELSGRSITDFVTREEREQFTRHVQSCREGACEYLAVHRDGTLFLVEARVTAVSLAGNTIHIVALHDRTAGKVTQLIAENHINEAEYLSKTALEFLGPMPIDAIYQYICEQVSSLAGTAIVAVNTYDVDEEETVIKAVSGSCLTALQDKLGVTFVGTRYGVSRDAFPQMATSELVKVPGGLRDRTFGQVPPELCEELEAEFGFKAFYRFPIVLDGLLLGMVLIAMIDQVTPQNPYLITAFVHQAGIAIQRCLAENELERERAYLATAIDMLPIPLTFITADHQVRRRNLAMQALLDRLGVAGELDFKYLDPILKVPVPDELHPVSRAFLGEVTHGIEFMLGDGHGQELPVMVYSAPIQLDGTLLATVSAVEDITVLKEADRVKDEFLTILSHELKTPLTCILGWSELGQIRKEPDFVQQALEVIYRNARRQQLLINELLDVSRLIYRRMAIVPQPLDFREQLLQATENMQLDAERRQLTLTVIPPDGPIPVMADPIRLQQCLGNVLQNSLKFTPAGGSVTVTGLQEDGWAVVKVIDTGRGMSQDIIHQLFRPFVQARRDEIEGGLGLGLALVHGIMALHNGQIIAESPGEGLGSTFTLRLPIDHSVSG